MDQSAFVPTSPHDPKVGPIYDLLQLFCDNEDPFTSDMVPACLTSGVLKWVSRLIMLTRKLPPMADDACQVFSTSWVFAPFETKSQIETITSRPEDHYELTIYFADSETTMVQYGFDVE